MVSVAKSLDDEQLRALALYYASSAQAIFRSA
jgi:cytochrome c553